MSIKQEVKEAKELVEGFAAYEYPIEEVCSHLNGMLNGFYYTCNGKIYRQNSPDYLPAIIIA